jgi:hypothetical protein
MKTLQKYLNRVHKEHVVIKIIVYSFVQEVGYSEVKEIINKLINFTKIINYIYQYGG